MGNCCFVYVLLICFFHHANKPFYRKIIKNTNFIFQHKKIKLFDQFKLNNILEN